MGEYIFMKIFRSLKGFTLTEIILVLVIGAVLTISVFIMYKKVDTNNRLNEELAYIGVVRSEMESIYTGFYNIPGRTAGQHLSVFMNLMNKPKVIFYPEASNSIYYKNSLGGKTYITYYGSGYNGNSALNHCIRISSKDYPLDRISNAYKAMGYYVEEFRSQAGSLEGLWICF
ncbi:type II secretion system protein [Klebsiella aerogenes]